VYVGAQGRVHAIAFSVRKAHAHLGVVGADNAGRGAIRARLPGGRLVDVV
jgi:hypothetical protein